MANYPDDRTRPSPKSLSGTEFLRVCCNIGAGSYFFSYVAGPVLGRVWQKNHGRFNRSDDQRLGPDRADFGGPRGAVIWWIGLGAD